jgi:hypothetical protein
MANVAATVKALEKERSRMMGQVARLDEAISALRGLRGGRGSVGRGAGRGSRHMSASARRRIAAAQKARWAKWRAAHKKAS